MDKALKTLSSINMAENGALFHVRRDGEAIWHLDREDGRIRATGFLGECYFDNLLQVIWHLHGHEVSFDDIYFDCI